jgi:hypothetical protein
MKYSFVQVSRKKLFSTKIENFISRIKEKALDNNNHKEKNKDTSP